MAGRVENKVALITGGGSGIGRATALLFGREGAKVLVADYNAEGGEHTVKTIKEAGGAAVFHAADVSNPQDVDGRAVQPRQRFGGQDLIRRPGGPAAGGRHHGPGPSPLQRQRANAFRVMVSRELAERPNNGLVDGRIVGLVYIEGGI